MVEQNTSRSPAHWQPRAAGTFFSQGSLIQFHQYVLIYNLQNEQCQESAGRFIAICHKTIQDIKSVRAKQHKDSASSGCHSQRTHLQQEKSCLWSRCKATKPSYKSLEGFRELFPQDKKKHLETRAGDMYRSIFPHQALGAEVH